MTLAAVILLHLGSFALLLRPILVPLAPPVETLIVFDVPLPPAPTPEAEKPGMPEAEAASAPPAPRAKPRPVAAPPASLPTPPAPTPVAPAPSTGAETQSGAAPAGPGAGAGGTGLGTGAGGSGAGQGGDGGKARARWKSGRIDRRDYPADAARANLGGQVTVHLEISPEGRVTRCTVARSSGIASLDSTTCSLIRQRFRYEPARDRAGNTVPDLVGWRQDWWLEPPR
jgi:protein TonB